MACHSTIAMALEFCSKFLCCFSFVKDTVFTKFLTIGTMVDVFIHFLISVCYMIINPSKEFNVLALVSCNDRVIKNKAFIKVLDKLTKEKTVVIVSHTLSLKMINLH